MRQLAIPQTKTRLAKPGRRKTARAISLRGANHITLRANVFVLRRNHQRVKRLIQETQCRYGLKLRTFSIMSNHIHLLAKVPTRKAMGDALRFLASRIAVEIGKGKFWIARAWSRPVTSRRDLDRATLYIATNAEREGIYDNTIDGYCIQNGMLVDEIRISAE